jgi:hypothetical protein
MEELVELYNQKVDIESKLYRHKAVRYRLYEEQIDNTFKVISKIIGHDWDVDRRYYGRYDNGLAIVKETESDVFFYFQFDGCAAIRRCTKKRQKLAVGMIGDVVVSVEGVVLVLCIPRKDDRYDTEGDLNELNVVLQGIEKRITEITPISLGTYKEELGYIEEWIEKRVGERYIECATELVIEDPERVIEEFAIEFETTVLDIFFNRADRLCVIYNVWHTTPLGGFAVDLSELDMYLVTKYIEYGYKTMIRNDDNMDFDYGCNYSVRFYLDKV